MSYLARKQTSPTSTSGRDKAASQGEGGGGGGELSLPKEVTEGQHSF